MSKTKGLDGKYKIKKGFIIRKIGDKTTIFDGEESALYTFNKTAAFIFDKIKQGLNEARIVRLLVREYSISTKRAESDLEELIRELKERKIIS